MKAGFMAHLLDFKASSAWSIRVEDSGITDDKVVERINCMVHNTMHNAMHKIDCCVVITALINVCAHNMHCIMFASTCSNTCFIHDDTCFI